MTHHSLPATDFIRIEQIIGNKKKGIPPLIPFSRATLYSRIKDGRFPPPDKRFGERIAVWHVDTIRRFIERAGGKD